MASARNESDEEHDSTDLRIVLLGVSGAGKSSVGNAILGREAFEECRTTESEIQRGRVEDRIISIIDTPGFFNTHLTDEELKKQMMKSLYLCSPGPHVFLLIINLENYRDDQRNIVQKILETFGEEALRFTMVLFIGREKVSRRALTQIIESEKTQKILSYFEGRFSVINSKHECGTNHITMLLRSIDEMTKSNRGQIYSNETYLKNMRQHKEQKEELFKVEKERMKPKEESKRDVNIKKNQEESESLKQKGGCQEEDIKTQKEEEKIKDHSERTQADVRKKTQYQREKEDIAVLEDICEQMESLRATLRTNPSRQTCLRILILGKTDAGKSVTANTILGRDVFDTGETTLSCEKQDTVVSGRNISIVDAPGLLDALWYKYTPEILKHDIKEGLDMCAPGPHVFLLVIKLNGKSTEEEKNTVKWIQENFGEEAVRHTFVLFTHVDLLGGEPLDQYIKKTPDLQFLVDSYSGRFHSFNNQDRDNRNQVTELFEKIEQLVKDNSGQHYDSEKRQKINSQDVIERDLHKLHRQTDLLGLMMNLELSKMAMNLSLARAMALSNLSKPGLRIVLLGFMRSGKSSTGNTILNRDVFGVSLLSATNTCEKKAGVVCGRNISIIDTPPIVLDHMWFIQHHKIEKSLEMSAPGPHVFLLVIEVEILTEEKSKKLKWIQENIEKDVLNHTIVLFTHTDMLNTQIEEPLKVYIRMHGELKSLVESCGCRYHSFSNEKTRDRLQVLKLLMKIDELMEKKGRRHYTKQNIFKAQKRNTKQDDDKNSCQIQ